MEGGRHKRRQLVRDPVDREDPLDAGHLGLGVGWDAHQRPDRDLAEVCGERTVALTWRARFLGDDLDQARDERQALPIVRGPGRVARLAQLTQVADHRDWARAVVATLEPPRSDRGIVGRAVKRERHLHVPLQAVDPIAYAAHTEVWIELIRDLIRKDIPVAWRSLGFWAVGPELGNGSTEVAPEHNVRRIRLTRGRVDGVTLAIVGS